MKNYIANNNFQIHENKFRRDQYIKLATFDNPDNVTRIEIINDILNDCKIGETCQPERYYSFEFHFSFSFTLFS